MSIGVVLEPFLGLGSEVPLKIQELWWEEEQGLREMGLLIV